MWQEPKTDWVDADIVSVEDFQRIEQNITYLQYLLR